MTHANPVPLRPRYDHYVGIVSPPASTDTTPQQLLSLCAGDRVAVLQNLGYYEGAEYSDDLPDADRRLDHLRAGIAGLADAKLDVVAQLGGYWSLPYVPTFERARALEAELSAEFGIPVILNWTAIADALHAVGAKTVTVAAGYYRPAWTEASVAFLESAGFAVVWAGDVIDLGVVADETERQAIEDATNWDYPDELVHQACVGAAAHAPDVDAVCQTGAGMRTAGVAASVETETKKPLVATDLALYWAIMGRCGIEPVPDAGSLLGGLR